MTFLELVQKLVRYSGMADSGPSTVTDQVGDYLKAVTYIQDAHAEVQSLHFDWDFLWGTGSFTTTAGIDIYPGISGLGIWDVDRIAASGNPLTPRSWADHTPSGDSGTPQYVIVRPDNQLLLYPVPNGSYTVTYDYYKRPRILVENSDTPLIPAQFRNVIVGRALMLYGNYESAADAKVQGAEMYQSALDQLEKHQLSRRQQTHGRQESGAILVVAE